MVRDLGSTQGVWIGSQRILPNRDAIWPRGRAVRIGQTVLALEASSDEIFDQASEEVGTPPSDAPDDPNEDSAQPSARGKVVVSQGPSASQSGVSAPKAETTRMAEAMPVAAGLSALSALSAVEDSSVVPARVEERANAGAIEGRLARIVRVAFVAMTGLFVLLALVATVWIATR